VKLDNRALGVLLSLTFTGAALTGLTCAPNEGALPTHSSGGTSALDPARPPLLSLRVGAPAPNLPLLDKDGNPYRPSGYHGRRVVLAFFRDSPECVQFAPQWEKLHRRSPDVIILGIATNGPGEIDGFRRATKVTFPLLFDRDYDRHRLDEQIRCPSTVAIDEEGRITSLSGPDQVPTGSSR
jgi:peroxiredoxin